ncbi:MAG: NAD-dependent epimerase/dehydratase family protein [Sporichthyaceae bacterium]|nr:NAD-dependent epimerase/dehydratase family protein [Sporichthyaceae bacterium]
MRVLVTGGAGFVGSHVVTALLESGHDVAVIDALLPEVHPNGSPWLPTGAEVHIGDVRDRTTVDEALRGVDAVCHQAAIVGLGVDFDDAPAYVGCNNLGTAVLLAAMAGAGVQRLVLASSMVVYGEGRYRCDEHGDVPARPRKPADLDAGRFEPTCAACGSTLHSALVTEDAPSDPRNVYAATKLAQEHLAACWARVTGGVAVALRYHNVYGPRMPRDTPYAGVAAIFRSALAAGRPPQVFEDGGQRRDFVHVSDVAGANVAALERLEQGPDTAESAAPNQSGPAPGMLRPYNVGSGTVHTVGEMAGALATAYGGPAPVVTAQFRLGDVRHITASSERIARELGWKAAVPFEDGTRQFAGAPLRGDPA